MVARDGEALGFFGGFDGAVAGGRTAGRQTAGWRFSKSRRAHVVDEIGEARWAMPCCRPTARPTRCKVGCRTPSAGCRAAMCRPSGLGVAQKPEGRSRLAELVQGQDTRVLDNATGALSGGRERALIDSRQGSSPVDLGLRVRAWRISSLRSSPWAWNPCCKHTTRSAAQSTEWRHHECYGKNDGSTAHCRASRLNPRQHGTVPRRRQRGPTSWYPTDLRRNRRPDATPPQSRSPDRPDQLHRRAVTLSVDIPVDISRGE